jgi:hypothetical protein
MLRRRKFCGAKDQWSKEKWALDGPIGIGRAAAISRSGWPASSMGKAVDVWMIAPATRRDHPHIRQGACVASAGLYLRPAYRVRPWDF